MKIGAIDEVQVDETSLLEKCRIRCAKLEVTWQRGQFITKSSEHHLKFFIGCTSRICHWLHRTILQHPFCLRLLAIFDHVDADLVNRFEFFSSDISNQLTIGNHVAFINELLTTYLL